MVTVIATNQTILVAGGGIGGLDGQPVKATKLEEIAAKPAKA